MPYRYLSFDGALLPEAMPEDDLSVGPVPSTLVDSLDGTFDYYGATQRLPKRQVINYRGLIVGEADTHLVDETLDDIVDESGDFIVLGADYAADLRDKTDDIKGKIGVYGQIVREREDDGMQQFKYGRMLEARHIRTVRDVDRIAALDIAIETNGGPWKKVGTPFLHSGLVYAGSTFFDVTIGGTSPVLDAVISVSAVGAPVTSVSLTASGGHNWTWTGTIAIGTALVIDCGALTVKNNGIDAYAGFVLDPSHTARGWLELPSNQTTALTIDLVGGPATINVQHNDQWM